MAGKGTYRTKEEKARFVMEVLSNSSTISEILRKYNVASSIYRRGMNSLQEALLPWNMADPPLKHPSSGR